MTRELWTIAQVAEHWGVSQSRARHILADANVTSGYDPETVEAIVRPGQGRRTDRATDTAHQKESTMSTDQYVTVGYGTDDDAYRVEVYTVGDPTADDVIDVPAGTDPSEHEARLLAATIAAERGLPLRDRAEHSA